MNNLTTGQAATCFASPELSSADEISREVLSLTHDNSLLPLLDAMPDFVMILNRNRQIIFANRKMREVGSAHFMASVVGLRPGELLNCERVAFAPSGCGTGQACATCGIVSTILTAFSGDPITRDCRLSAQGIEAFDLRVWASPFTWNTVNYVLVIATDISNEKRRRVLERIFFHDILNAAHGVRSIAELLDGEAVMDNELSATLHDVALLAAENNELGVSLTPLHALEVIKSAVSQLRNHNLSARKKIVIAHGTRNFDLISDGALLSRSLANLLKNALEASGPGSTITLGARIEEAGNVFWCHNPGVIPPEVQHQIFQRGFSTKGTGRGIGTYSVRLLTERYLQGTVVLESSEPDGTTFRITVPMLHENEHQHEPLPGTTP